MPELQLYPHLIDKTTSIFIKPVFEQDTLPPKNELISKRQKNIYISLGTLNKNEERFWEVCILFFMHYDANVIISVPVKKVLAILIIFPMYISIIL